MPGYSQPLGAWKKYVQAKLSPTICGFYSSQAHGHLRESRIRFEDETHFYFAARRAKNPSQVESNDFLSWCHNQVPGTWPKFSTQPWTLILQIQGGARVVSNNLVGHLIGIAQLSGSAWMVERSWCVSPRPVLEPHKYMPYMWWSYIISLWLYSMNALRRSRPYHNDKRIPHDPIRPCWGRISPETFLTNSSRWAHATKMHGWANYDNWARNDTLYINGTKHFRTPQWIWENSL